MGLAVGVIIDDPQVNSMDTFNFTSALLNEGTTFTFGLWVCVADGAGNFHWHLVDNTKPEAPTTTPCRDLDEFVDSLGQMLLLVLAREMEEESIFNATSTRAAPGLPRSDLTWSEDQRTRLPFGLCSLAPVYQEDT
jgi:hypothetical protein